MVRALIRVFSERLGVCRRKVGYGDRRSRMKGPRCVPGQFIGRGRLSGGQTKGEPTASQSARECSAVAAAGIAGGSHVLSSSAVHGVCEFVVRVCGSAASMYRADRMANVDVRHLGNTAGLSESYEGRTMSRIIPCTPFAVYVWLCVLQGGHPSAWFIHISMSRCTRDALSIAQQ
ncbi:unnamed protein product [Hapterophycus canaliculatus]